MQALTEWVATVALVGAGRVVDVVVVDVVDVVVVVVVGTTLVDVVVTTAGTVLCTAVLAVPPAHPAAIKTTTRPTAGRLTRLLRWTAIRTRSPYLLVASALLAASCSGSVHSHLSEPTLPTATSPTTRVVPTTTTTTTTTLPPMTTTTLPAFSDTISAVTASDVPHTWRPGCPVSPSQLRMLRMTYWGFDSHPHTGAMVVNASVAGSVVAVFRTLYGERFPIEEMVPQDAYGGNDNAAAAADDTSGFNCRYAVAPGPPQWSVHAYGEAIDVNDVQNPYVEGSTIIPPAGAAYLNRSDVRPGMAVPGGELVDAFASVGWQWGGRWTASPDYQHFSSTGG